MTRACARLCSEDVLAGVCPCRHQLPCYVTVYALPLWRQAILRPRFCQASCPLHDESAARRT